MEMRKQSRFRERLDDCAVSVETRKSFLRSAVVTTFPRPETTFEVEAFATFRKLFRIITHAYTKK